MNFIEMYQAKQENTELRLGKIIIPHNLQDHQTHIEIHLAETNPNPELIKHIELHKMMVELEQI